MPTTYYPERNVRRITEYPHGDSRSTWKEYNPEDLEWPGAWFGPIIDSSLVFDEVRIRSDQFAGIPIRATVYASDQIVSIVPGPKFHETSHGFAYEHDFSEVAEIRRRVDAGTCRITYTDDLIATADTPKTLDQLDPSHWLLATRHPFDSDHRHDFFRALIKGYSYTAVTDGPDIFKVPGIWKDDSKPQFEKLVFHKRSATEPPIPPILFDGNRDTFIADHATEGWTIPVPEGFQDLYEYEVEFGFMSDGVPWTDRGRVYQERGIEIPWKYLLRNIAKVFKAWEDGLSTTDLASNAITRKRTWWKTRIGYAWKLVEDETVSVTVLSSVFGVSTTRTVSGHEAVMNWATEDLKRLAGAGVATFAPDDGQLEVLLDQPTLAKIEADNTFGEGVSGLVDAADWTAYQTTHYQSALAYT